MIVVVASTLGGGGGDGSSPDGGSSPSTKATHQQGMAKRNTPKVYVVQNGDTLTSIAHDNGVSVAKILRLNPGVDPQILVSGEKLKLR